ncbi:hypothetical protein [Paenibacillus contaminans]|uniref:DUF4760 domain-containing protein n=1 Tax=Paenibacillus contaminans TaxID=450362 RepID=A0A329MHJ9_9BACL|nr:hypothetical protein [Paenibacillus contaminans]RAV18846.1 hypothetical protein DQG23_24260 [Paenibacillus contaminans]
MLEWLDKYRVIFETLYFLSSIGLVTTIIIGLKQLKLVKQDIILRNKRASVEKSIEYLNWFATEFIPDYEKFEDNLLKDNVVNYPGPYTEFVFTSTCNTHVPSIQTNLDKSTEYGGTGLINQIEFFSAALLSGLADEELAFNPLASLYCDIVEKLYIVLCDHRDDDSQKFLNTVKLYRIWSARLKKLDDDKKQKNNMDASNFGNQRIESIGT